MRGYPEVISIVSIIQRLFLLSRGYPEVISIVSIIQRLFLLCPLSRGFRLLYAHTYIPPGAVCRTACISEDTGPAVLGIVWGCLVLIGAVVM